MPKPTIFISYSHEDEEWKNHLVNQLGVLQHQGLLEVWDDSRIGAGEDWHQEIQRTMDKAHVAILLVSANFLNSQFVLSEEVPRLLLRQHRAGLCIFPVIIKPCAYEYVPWLNRMQIRPVDCIPLSVGTPHQRDTQLVAIVQEIAGIIRQPRRPLPRFRGPRYVQFVVVAGRADELADVRTNVASYGNDALEWRPYYPSFQREVGPLVQHIASDEDFASGFLHLDPDLINKLEQAKRENNIVVVIVDAWTIQLPGYCDLMREYDARSFLNCAALIPWNTEDDETELNRDHLELALQATFSYKTIAKDPKSFREMITSPDQFDSELRDVLIEIRRRILETGQVMRRAIGEGIVVLPYISGPGGVEPS